MPDSALQATERQFTQLLKAAAGDSRIHFHCFSLPSIKRSQIASQIIEGHYADIADLDRLHIDALSRNRRRSRTPPTLPEEPFWPELTAVIDWAKPNTRSTIWVVSCRACRGTASRRHRATAPRREMLGHLRLFQGSRRRAAGGTCLAAQDIAFALQMPCAAAIWPRVAIAS